MISVKDLTPFMLCAIPVEVAPVYHMNVVDFIHSLCLLIELSGLHISLNGISGHLCKASFRQVRVQRLIAQRDDEPASAALYAVELRVAGSHIPGCRVGFKAVASTAALEIDLVQLLGNSYIRFELADLDRRSVVGKISDAHDHEFDVHVCSEKLNDDLVELCGHLHGGASHRSRHVEGENDGKGVRVLFIFTAFPDHVFRIKCGIDRAVPVHALDSLACGVDRSVPSDLAAVPAGVCSEIFISPSSISHGVTSSYFCPFKLYLFSEIF